MAIPLGISIWSRGSDRIAFAASMVATVCLGLLMARASRKNGNLSQRECLAVVTLGWIFAAGIGALPFVLSGSLPSYSDSFFEAMSGLTTTGATVIADVERQPYGILFWRGFLHWLGGMGIIVLFIAVLPNIGAGAARLFRAEAPGPAPERLEPRIKATAKSLWMIYVAFSIVETCLLCLGGMSLFDSVIHTFATMATGGFSTRNASVGAWQSPFIRWTITIFMLIAGGNFALYHRAIRYRRAGGLRVFRDEEFVFYLGIVAVATLVIALSVYGIHYDHPGDSIREACFQVSSIITTTGFVTANYDLWPSFAKGCLFLLMFIGGSTGSTGGAMKVARVIMILKHGCLEIHKFIHPRAVTSIKMNGGPVRAEVLNGVLGFVLMYLVVFATATLAMAAIGLDLLSAASAVAATLGNVGPGLGSVGPSCTYAPLPAIGKWVLSFCMLLGRLEIFTVLVLLVPDFWRNR